MIDVEPKTRRRTPRAKIPYNEVIYLSLPEGNGAVVLDVSAEGLGFQAADTIEPSDSLSCRLSGPACPDLDLTGTVTWLDQTQKRGGLRLHLSAEAKAAFLDWQQKRGGPIDPPDELPAPPPRAAASARAPAPPASVPPLRPAGPRNGQVPSYVRRPGPIFGASGPNFVSEWDGPEPPRAGRNLLTVIVIAALCVVVAGGSYYLSGRRQMGTWVIHLGQSIRGTSPNTSAPPVAPQENNSRSPAASAASTQTAPPTSPSSPNAVAQNSGAAAPSGTNPSQAASSPGASPWANPAAPQSQADPNASNPAPAGAYVPAAQPAQPLNSAPADVNPNPGSAAAGTGGALATNVPADVPNSPSSAPARVPPPVTPRADFRRAHAASPAHASAAQSDHGELYLAQAERYLDSSNPQDSALAAQLLWSAIGDGNTQAELILGGMYMRGQGAVHRNCRQAEALLHAALVADVPGAAGEIQKLQTYGCR